MHLVKLGDWGMGSYRVHSNLAPVREQVPAQFSFSVAVATVETWLRSTFQSRW